MQKQHILQKDYTRYERTYQLKLPIDISPVIPQNETVRLLDQWVEEMDLTSLYATYKRHRKNHVTPRQMLKLVLYATWMDVIPAEKWSSGASEISISCNEIVVSNILS